MCRRLPTMFRHYENKWKNSVWLPHTSENFVWEEKRCERTSRMGHETARMYRKHAIARERKSALDFAFVRARRGRRVCRAKESCRCCANNRTHLEFYFVCFSVRATGAANGKWHVLLGMRASEKRWCGRKKMLKKNNVFECMLSLNRCEFADVWAKSKMSNIDSAAGQNVDFSCQWFCNDRHIFGGAYMIDWLYRDEIACGTAFAMNARQDREGKSSLKWREREQSVRLRWPRAREYIFHIENEIAPSMRTQHSIVMIVTHINICALVCLCVHQTWSCFLLVLVKNVC